MKNVLVFIQVIIIMVLSIQFVLIGVVWGVFSVGFNAGIELGQQYFEYVDKAIKDHNDK